MRPVSILITLVLPFFAGCWAIENVNEAHELDRSLPYGTPVRSGSISAKTPYDSLILEKSDIGLILRSVNIGIVPPDHYSALHNTLQKFNQVVEQDKKNALSFKTFDSLVKGNLATIYFARYQKGDVVQIDYYTYLGNPTDGYSVEYEAYYRASAFNGETWWDKVPVPFISFLDSLEFSKTPSE